MMERQVTHLVRLVDDLLEVSRITRGMIDVQREPLDLATLVRAALETTRRMFEAARSSSSPWSCRSEPITIEGDSVRLTQVFANLLTNAAKYTNAGGRISAHACGASASAPSSRARQWYRHPAGRTSTRCSRCSCKSTARIAARKAGSASA